MEMKPSTEKNVVKETTNPNPRPHKKWSKPELVILQTFAVTHGPPTGVAPDGIFGTPS
jgi:hypothetical protein